MNSSAIFKTVLALLLLIVVVVSAVGWYWSHEPELFDVKAQAKAESLSQKKEVVIGVTTTATLIHSLEVMLEKPGGFISNDVTPPGIVMDNIPNWEYGVLTQARDLTRSMRDSMSRSQSQSTEDDDLAKAESRLNISRTAWALPDAQSEYRDGIKHLRNYLNRLADNNKQDAQFYARADNLRHWLQIVEVRLGSLSQKLSASVGQRRLNTDLAGDAAAQQSTNSESEIVAQTSWFEIDDVFYEARGSAWALIHILKAIEVDFAEVLKNKNAQVSLAQITRELESTQQPLMSPMVLNGSGFGMTANHSLVMASYISRANAAIIDLRELLEKG